MSYTDYEKCGYCRYCICDNAAEDVMNGKFRCTRENIWVFADANPVKSNCFWKVNNWNLSDRDSAINMSHKYRNFYITTALFLRLDKICSKDLDILYAFRDNYLDSNEREFMDDYDVFGPYIARIILTTQNDSLIHGLFEFYINGTLKLIKQEKFDEASELYESMYRRLKKLFISQLYGRDKLLIKPNTCKNNI